MLTDATFRTVKGLYPVQDFPNSMTPQDALVAVMIAVSASNEDIRTAELIKIQSAVNMLPVFADFDVDHLKSISQVVFDLFGGK